MTPFSLNDQLQSLNNELFADNLAKETSNKLNDINKPTMSSDYFNRKDLDFSTSQTGAFRQSCDQLKL